TIHTSPPSVFFFTPLPPPISTLFPYTTLFRSEGQLLLEHAVGAAREQLLAQVPLERFDVVAQRCLVQERRRVHEPGERHVEAFEDRKSTRLNSSHVAISYAVFCLKKKKKKKNN